MVNTIRKTAKIVRITPDQIEVEMCRPDACGVCGARALCYTVSRTVAGHTGHAADDNKGGDTGKRMTVLNDRQGYQKGEQVTLVMKQTSGLKAVIIAYLIPAALIIGLLLAGQYTGISETNTALIALGVLVLYFTGLRAFRGRLNRTLTIEIEKTNYPK